MVKIRNNQPKNKDLPFTYLSKSGLSNRKLSRSGLSRPSSSKPYKMGEVLGMGKYLNKYSQNLRGRDKIQKLIQRFDKKLFIQ